MPRRCFVLFLAVICIHAKVHAQSYSQLPEAPAPVPDPPTIRNLPRNFLHDQAGIWTTPLRVSDGEAVAGILFIASAGALGSEDANIMQHHFLDQNTANHANTASTGLVGLLVAAPVAYYGIGHLHHHAEDEQTGVLAGEAIADGLAVNLVAKGAARRERPTVDDARGHFLAPGVGIDSSFASNHSVVAWSSATVIASRSNRLSVKLAAYGLATGVSATRVIGRDHFPSDVYVGSALGWMIGRYVLHHHTRQDD